MVNLMASGAAKTSSKSKANGVKGARGNGRTGSTAKSAGKSPNKSAARKASAKKAAAPKAASKKNGGVAPAAARKSAPAPTSASAAKKPTVKGKSAVAAKSAPLPASGGSLKQRFAALHTATREITGMKRSIATSFFDVGVVLNRIRDKRLYEVKGYGSFESFVEREIDLNKVICLRSARIAQAIDRDIAVEAGLDRAAAAVAALDGEAPNGEVVAGTQAAAPTLIPLHKQ